MSRKEKAIGAWRHSQIQTGVETKATVSQRLKSQVLQRVAVQDPRWFLQESWRKLYEKLEQQRAGLSPEARFLLPPLQ